MSSDKMLEKIKDAVEEAIRPILGKGSAMSAAELDILNKAICTVEKIKQMEDNEKYKEFYRNNQGNNSYEGGNSYLPNVIAHNNGYVPNNSYGEIYDYYSNQRGRSATTGRYVSRDSDPRVDGYSTRRYYDGGENQRNNYSGHSIYDRMIAQLEQMYDKAQTEHERQVVNEWINRIEKDK